MKERVSFVLEWERRWDEAQGGPVEMAELCRNYGVSRPTGYAWVTEDLVVQARKLMPRRGPRKLRRILVDRHPEIDWPSTSSIGNILKRRGLCRVRKSR